MKGKRIKIISLLLALMLMLPAMVSAATYSDVDENHWAYQYIMSLSNDKIIEGYPDGSYLPSKDVTFPEVLKLLYGVMDPDLEETGKAKVEYHNEVVNAGVPDWARESVAVALYRKVLSPTNLMDAKDAALISNNPTRVPDRNTIAIYFAKGLGMEPSEDYEVLKHGDKDEIPEVTKKYLVPLIKAGIFESTGSDGNFEGRRGIRRAEMAKITYLSNEYMEKHGNEEVAEGKVLISTSTDEKTIIVDVGNSNISIATDDKTEFTLNGKPAKYEDIAEGQKVKITYVKDDSFQVGNRAVKVEAETDEVKAIGYVKDVLDNSLKLDYTEHPDKVKFDSLDKFDTDKTATFTLAKDIKITEYDKEIELEDVKDDDIVEFTVKNNEIIKLNVIPKNYKVKGVVEEVKDRKTDADFGTIVLKLDDDKKFDFFAEKNKKDISYYTDEYFKIKDLDKVKAGDEVELTLKYKVITGIGEPAPEVEDYYGQITGMFINDQVYINDAQVKRKGYDKVTGIEFFENNDKKNLKLASNFVINVIGENDGEVFDLSDLWNQRLKVRLINGKVVEISVIKDDVDYLEGKFEVNSIEPYKGDADKVVLKAKILSGLEGKELKEKNPILDFPIDADQQHRFNINSKYKYSGYFKIPESEKNTEYKIYNLIITE